MAADKTCLRENIIDIHVPFICPHVSSVPLCALCVAYTELWLEYAAQEENQMGKSVVGECLKKTQVWIFPQTQVVVSRTLTIVINSISI